MNTKTRRKKKEMETLSNAVGPVVLSPLYDKLAKAAEFVKKLKDENNYEPLVIRDIIMSSTPMPQEMEESCVSIRDLFYILCDAINKRDKCAQFSTPWDMENDKAISLALQIRNAIGMDLYSLLFYINRNLLVPSPNGRY